MYVLMRTSLGTTTGTKRKGQIYDVAASDALQWISRGIAEATTTPPGDVAAVLARLDIGAGGVVFFKPFVGEMGHHVFGFLPLVQHSKAAIKIVACREGEQVLTPSASFHFTDWKDEIDDLDRVGSMREPLDWSGWDDLIADLDAAVRPDFDGITTIDPHGLTTAQELVAVHPEIRIPFRPRLRGFDPVDVVLGIRHRQNCPQRNWPHWGKVAVLMEHGYTTATIGRAETSTPAPGSKYFSGDYPDTDAAIELLQNCRLFVGTDTGTAHLAAAVGCQMLIFREYRGGSRDFTPRMEKVNPGRVEIIKDGWTKPQAVIDAILKRLSGDSIKPWQPSANS